MRQIISVNKVQLYGTLGKDAETRFTTSNKAVTSFSLATNYSIKRGDGYEQKTDWHNIVAWDGNDNVKDLKKGTTVLIEGRISYDSYEKDGEKKYITKIIADEILIAKGGNVGNSSRVPPAQNDDTPEGDDKDDLPF